MYESKRELNDSDSVSVSVSDVRSPQSMLANVRM